MCSAVRLALSKCFRDHRWKKNLLAHRLRHSRARTCVCMWLSRSLSLSPIRTQFPRRSILSRHISRARDARKTHSPSIYPANMSQSGHSPDELADIEIDTRSTWIREERRGRATQVRARRYSGFLRRISAEYPNDMDASCNTRYSRRAIPTTLAVSTPGQFASQMELAVVRRVRWVCLPDVERDCSVDLGRQRYITSED